jgi:hypothetical protein
MSATKVITCEFLRRAVEFIFENNAIDYEIIWIEPALHERPQILNKKLQEILDAITDCDKVLMPFGECGNATRGLKAGNFEMILPKLDDCLSLLLGSYERRLQISEEAATYFMTLDWASSVVENHKEQIARFGEENTRMINDTLFANYKRIALIDAGIGNKETLKTYQKPLKEIMGLDSYFEQGTTDYLKLLFTGPWDDKYFNIIPPYGEIKTVW